jgi:hypothetical protein
MERRSLVTLGAAFALAALATPGRAQDTPKPEAAKAAEAAKSERRDRMPTAMLRVQVVLSRFQGEKKLASLPYTFTVATESRPVRMRMGIDTPVPVATYAVSEQGVPKPATSSYQYKTVGTNLDCTARDLGDGRYQLMLGVENSAAVTGVGSSVEGVPLFRRFETSLDPVLHDGQSLQTVTSTDPVTGEVVKIDVTLNVVK